MRSTTVVALFAGSVAAQSSAVVVNPLMPAATLTMVGSSEGTTTYVNSCSDGGIPASYLSPEASGSASAKASSIVASLRSSAGPASLRSSASALMLTPIAAPSTTAAARLRRQEDGVFGGFCEPVTIKQGASTVQIHLEDPTEGAWTADMNCAWKGEVTAADLTCTATQSGSFAELNELPSVTSQVLKASEAAEISAVQTVAVVEAASNSAAPTASGSGAPNATASGSGAPAATGNAAAGSPLPKGVMAFVGGAAGVFAAALAL